MSATELRRLGAPGVGGRSGGLSQLVLHCGMLLATLAFASWWTSRTILDTARTRRVTDAVLENANVRNFLANKVAAITTPAVGAGTLSAATGAANTATAENALGSKLATVLDRPDIRAKLESFVVNAHDVLIGASTKPAVLDQATVQTLVGAAVPSLSPAELAKVHAVKFSVPRVGALSTTRNTLAHRFWLFAAGAVLLLALAIGTTRDRRSTLKVVGRWLIGISVLHLVVLWILPVVVVPKLSSSPWADVVAAVARALNAGIITGLVVLAVAGVGFLIADRLVKPSPAAAPPLLAPGTLPET